MPESLSALLPDLLARGRAAQQNLVAGLAPAERDAAGSLERWSAKDLIAHLTAWYSNLVTTLEAARAGETPPALPNFDEANARTFAENARKTFTQILDEAAAAFDRLAALLPRFSDADLLQPDRYPWRRGQPLARSVLLRLYWHPMVHLGQHQAQRGNRAAVDAIRADLHRAAGELAWLPGLSGQTLYMAACCSAALGNRQAAVSELRECLALTPDMRQWSQQDPSLAAIRDDPEYAALYQ